MKSSKKLDDLEALVLRQAEAILHNAQAIQRNTEAIATLSANLERLVTAIGELQRASLRSD